MSEELPPDAPDLSATQYQLEKLLGQGGFGQAYLAFNRGLRRRCVLKVLTDINNSGFVARFYREAQVMANLEHPTIPRVYEVATTKSGQPYFVMEFIDGKSLGEHLADEGGVLPLSEACRLIADAAEGLAAAHDIGVVHRDVKLANLLVNKRGQMKVIDFGIAKKTIEDAEKTVGIMTQVGQLFGTPRYMSPEQAMAKPLGPSSDLYSLGIVLVILLTGRSPFDGTPHEMMTGHVKTPAPKLSELSGQPFPPTIEALVARLLAKDPGARFASGNELATALRVAGGVAQSLSTSQPSWPTPVAVAGSFAARDAMTPSGGPTERSPMPPPAVAAPAPARSSVPRSTDVQLGEAVRRAMAVEPSIAVAPIVVSPSAATQATNVAVRGFTADEGAQTELAMPVIDYAASTSATEVLQQTVNVPVRAPSENSDRVVIRPAKDPSPIIPVRPRVEQVGKNEATPSALQTFVGQPATVSRSRAPLFVAIAVVVLLGAVAALFVVWPRGGGGTGPAGPKETTTAPPAPTKSAPNDPGGATAAPPAATPSPTTGTTPTALPTATTSIAPTATASALVPKGTSKPLVGTSTAKPTATPTATVAPPATTTVTKPTASAAPTAPPKPSGKVLDDDRT